jgi:hypothetical protein
VDATNEHGTKTPPTNAHVWVRVPAYNLIIIKFLQKAKEAIKQKEEKRKKPKPEE